LLSKNVALFKDIIPESRFRPADWQFQGFLLDASAASLQDSPQVAHQSFRLATGL